MLRGGEEKKGELSTPSSATNRIFWTPSSSTAQEKAKRKNLCCSNVLSAAVKGFCVDHFLFKRLSLSLSRSYYRSINPRQACTTSEQRKSVARAICSSVHPFIPSVLPVLCSSPAAHVHVSMCLCISFLLIFFLSSVSVRLPSTRPGG